MEYTDLVDRRNKVIGVTDIEIAHKLKLYHRVIGIFVFSNEGGLYLQKHKKYGCYDNSVGGHVKVGESDDVAAKRELREELNIEIPVIKLSTFIPKKSKIGHVWSIYEGVLPENWYFKETREVDVLENKKIEEWASLMRKKPEIFTQGVINVMEEYLKKKNILIKGWTI